MVDDTNSLHEFTQTRIKYGFWLESQQLMGERHRELKMTSMHRPIVRIATRVIEILKLIAISRTGIEGVAVTKVIEFYIPTSFRKTMKWVPAIDRGKIIEFCPQTKKSA